MYLIYKTSTGAPVSLLSTNKEVNAVRNTKEDEAYIAVPVNTDINRVYVAHGEAVYFSEKPTKYSVFNYATKQWEDPRTLKDLKMQQWGLIKQARETAEYAGFTWNAYVFDSDTLSQNRITGAVTLAQLSTDFSVDWVLADNTVRTLNQVEMLQVGAALGNHVAEQFSKGVILRNAIDAATSKEEVESILWN